jgi:hypothetical protein
VDLRSRSIEERSNLIHIHEQSQESAFEVHNVDNPIEEQMKRIEAIMRK